jgi:hypothetical protein
MKKILLLMCILNSKAILTKSHKVYIDINSLSPGQLRYTQVNVNTKANRLKQSNKTYNNGTSSMPISSAIPVILGPNNLVVAIDSHHEFLAAKKIGDTNVPIEVKDDFSHLTKKEFFEEAKLKNYIYPYDKIGNLIPMPKENWYTWDAMQDDPNRLFAAFTALKGIPKNYHKDPNAMEEPKYPLWKKNLTQKVLLAFIEFKIATILYKNNLIYNYNWGTNPNSKENQKFTEEARKILNQALYDGSIPNFELIKPKDTSY